jgi:diguanylate cyclase (GGDEF)-like protein
MLAQIEQPPSLSIRPVTGLQRPGRERDQVIDVLVVTPNRSRVQALFANAEDLLGVRFSVDVAESMEDGLRRLHERPADVTVVDLAVAGSDGPSVVETVLSRAPNTAVVVLVDGPQQAWKAASQGAQAYLLRDSLDGTLLVRTLHYAFERNRLGNALGSFATDPFTGLYSRHIFLVMGEQYLKLAQRLGSIVAFFGVLEDVRCINPSLSHLEEQRLLMHAGRILKKTFRSSDLHTHWGRFEFATLALGVTAVQVPMLLHRLASHAQAFNQDREFRHQVHFSIGFATADSAKAQGLTQLICAADRLRRRLDRTKSQ